MKTKNYTFLLWCSPLSKPLFLFILSYTLALTNAFAQQESTSRQTQLGSKYYVGATFSNTQYMLEYGPLGGGSLMPLFTVHAGYKLTKRLNLQVALGYNKHDEEFKQESYVNEDDEHLTYGLVSITSKGLIAPISLQFTPFNPDKKLRLYGLATFAPILGSNHVLNQSTYDGETTTRYDLKDSGMNYIFLAGLHARYKASERIDVFVDGNLFYKNLVKYSMYGERKPRSVGIGLNYNFK